MNQRKLLLNERVEVRQFEEGLRGSWHPGVVVGVSKLCRSVEYDELLSETGDSKLVESIPVTEAIEGLHSRRHVPSTYRGHIRPSPPSSDKKFSFGVCVDVLFEDAWWEGVVFDCHDDADERLVFFPDEDDEQKFSTSHLRLARDWDEFLGIWRERGVWILVRLAMELEGHVPSSNYVKKIWSYLRLNYGFNKMISEWTCGARNVWRKYYMDVVHETAVESSRQVLHDLNLTPVMEKKGKTAKDSKRVKIMSGLYITSLKERNRGALNVSRSSQKTQEKYFPHEWPRNKRTLKSKSRSMKWSSITITKKSSFHADNCCGGTQVIDLSSSTMNDNVKAKTDNISGNSFGRDKVAISVSLSTQNKHPGEVKLDVEKKKNLKVCEVDGNQCLVDCSEQEKIVHVKKNGSIRRRENLTKSRQIKINLAINFPNCSRKLRKKKPSLVTVTKQRKCSSTKERVSKEFQRANSKLKSLSKVEEKVVDIKPAKNYLSIDQCHRALPIKNCRKSVSPKSKRSHPRKSKRRRGFCGIGDTICSFCHYGGDLMCCNKCPSSYHLSCLDLKDVPHGKWLCPSCCCGLCGKGDNSLFNNACLQCGRTYHVYCLSKARCLLPMDYPSENFCSKACYELCAQLHQLLGISNPTSVDGLTWTLTRSSKNVYSFPGISRSNTCIKLSHVLRVMHECFIPVKDPHTKRDPVRDLVYNSGSKLRRLNFHGFYAIVLHRGDEIVSVATVRIHGLKAAEMPLVATPFQYRRQGMCRLLLHELLKLLTKLGVERLVLPAIAQLRKTWETSFGFSEMHKSERLQLSGYSFMGFQGTIMLQKVLSSSGLANETKGTCQDSKESSSSICLVWLIY
ncbi:hypothetical protein P3X46_018341 [Hevea brasiliensis]|uniref:PHD-type domain-containing protein n=1 Tax=Hevea brasiliensis TaxID=3981 RepID=A0ABQ9LQD6_HEVBR|nr:hypothetical protein P3X46_018341 [Hevea brasiliensis]